MKRIAALVFAALVLTGCGGKIPNPLSSNNIYQTKLVYAATLTAADKWRTYCWARPYAVLMTDPIAKPICANRRPVARGIATASRYAGSAINKAQSFIAANPTLSAASLVSAADDAVMAFRNVTPAVPLQ